SAHWDRRGVYYGVEALPPYPLTCPAGPGVLPACALPARLCDPVGPSRLAPCSRLPVRRLPGERPASLVGPVHLLRPSGPGKHTGWGALSRHAGAGRDGPRLRPRYSAVLARVDRGFARRAGRYFRLPAVARAGSEEAVRLLWLHHLSALRLLRRACRAPGQPDHRRLAAVRAAVGLPLAQGAELARGVTPDGHPGIDCSGGQHPAHGGGDGSVFSVWTSAGRSRRRTASHPPHDRRGIPLRGPLEPGATGAHVSTDQPQRGAVSRRLSRFRRRRACHRAGVAGMAQLLPYLRTGAI